MDYGLAKELEEAGFPQGEMPYYDSEGFIHRTAEEERSWVYTPTLEELIEACGAQFVEGSKVYGFTLNYLLGAWYANYTDDNDKPTPKLNNGVGPTPTEAVAKLYLALHQK